MKHSPFAFFRKHQRVGMVILTVMAMFAFVFLDQTFRGMGGSGAHANQVAVKIKGGNLTYDKIAQLISERVAANRFIEAVARAIIEDYPKDQSAQLIARGVMQQQFGRDFPGDSETEQGLQTSVMWGHVMRLEAKRLGLVVDDRMVESYITRMSAHRLSADRFQEILKTIGLKEKHLFDAFREEILAKMATNALFPRISQTPEQYWEFYKRLKVEQNLEIAALPVSEFSKTLGKPSDRELETLFNANKTRFSNDAPDYWKPGFRQPTRVRVQYLTTTYDQVESRVNAGKDKYVKAVTDKDVADYYEQKKDPLFVEVEFDEPKDDSVKKETDPLNPSIAPEKPEKPALPEGAKPKDDAAGDKQESKPANPPASKPAEKPAGDKPAEPSTEKPTTEKPASDKPAADQPGTKPESKPETKPEEKPTEKPAEAKPADAADKKPCGEEPDAEKPAEKSADAKSEEVKPAAEKAAEAKPTEPATTEPKAKEEVKAEAKPADAAKPAGDKPAETKPAAAKTEETKPEAATPAAAKSKTDDAKPKDGATKDDATKKDAKPDFKPPKFKPLADVKDRIREDLEKARTLDALKAVGEDAKRQLEEFQIRFAYGPTIQGKLVFIDFNENDKVDEDEPSAETAKKLTADDVNKLPPEIQDELNTKLFEASAVEMKKIGDRLGLEYKSTELISPRDLEADPKLGKIADVNSNDFQAHDSGKIRQELFGTESKFHVKVGLDPETNLYVYWKVEHVKEHIAKFSDPGIKEEVTATWKMLEAYPLAQKRAEALVKEAEGKKNLYDAFKGATVSGDKEGLALEVHETGDFSWMSGGVPSPNMMQGSQAKLSEVNWAKDIDDEFMQVACEDLKVGDVGYAPNRDHSVVFVIRVVNRTVGKGAGDLAQLREKFMKEQLFESFPAGMDPMFRQFYAPPPYAQMAFAENSRLYFDWLESLKRQYQITWTDDLRNY